MLGLVLLIGEVPVALSVCCAPPGASGMGTAWFVNDFAQYESAMRQGAEQSGWLVHDVFTAEPHDAAFMFPLYVAIGKLAATVHVPAIVIERAVEALARALLVVALWRFCRAFAAGRAAARWAFGFTLFASGFELFAAVYSMLRGGGGVYTGNWSYETNGFGLLFAAPHVPLAMAATLEIAHDVLRARRTVSRRWLFKIGLLSATVALLHPFHLPVLLAATLLAGAVFMRTERGRASLIGALAACVAAVPVLVPTIVTFSFDPFWQATYSLQNVLPSPGPRDLVIDLGLILVLALGGAVMLRERVAPIGLLGWLLLILFAMYLPVPYQRRLSFGIHPVLAVLAANSLVAACAWLKSWRARVLRLAVVATATVGTLLILVSIVASGFKNTPLPIYRSTRDLDAVAAWLNAQAQPGDVILADWQAANYLAPRTPARVFGGHPVATAQADIKELATRSVFASTSSLTVAQQLGVQWLVYGPGEANLTPPDGAAFQSGVVRVYRVSPG
ncbi:MAG TPA: hypothetical protein VKV73_09500 [Chloroflexota bacterium]|nr:hypothetical protein [Chloroflexota bacterium]